MEPLTLDGPHVRLEPLGEHHVEALVAAARDRRAYGFTAVPDGPMPMAAYVRDLLAQRDRGEALPFVQVRRGDGRVVGATRYLSFERHPHDPDVLLGVEIGGTWLAADALRTAVNTEAKLLLLAHAFEEWHVARVQLLTDARNQRSRDAIGRLGAAFEGVLRRHRLAAGDAVEEGVPRDSAVYSIIHAEWPSVRAELRRRLARGAPA